MKRIFLTSIFIACVCTHSPAATIKIAFHNGSVTTNGFGPRPDGAVFASSTDTINNIQNNDGVGATFSGVSLDLADGNSTSATIAGSAGFINFNNNGWGSGTDDAVMMEGWYGFRGTESLTLSGLETALGGMNYNITIYGDPGSSRVMGYTIGGNTKTITSVAKYDGANSPAFVEGSDFITFNDLSGDGAIEISGNPLNSDPRSAISGIVITTIPEPSSVALFGLAGIGLMFRRRR